jgi:hypothetical protein
MKEYHFKPNGHITAGFYADMGHSLTDNLKNYLNEIYNSNPDEEFIVKIDSSKLWRLYQPANGPLIDYYNELFQIDPDFHLKLPLKEKMKDGWTNISKIKFEEFNQLLRKYFKMSDKQQLLFEEIIKKYSIDPTNTLGILYRGTDKYTERAPVDVNVFLNKAKDILSLNPELRIMITTDQQQVRDLFVASFPDNCFFLEEMPYVTNNIVPHNHEHVDKYLLARYFEISIRILAQCKFLICSYSNSTTFIGAYRNNCTNVFQF